MRKIYTFITAVLVTASVFQTQQANAQSPQKMSYQAVIRNSSNTLLTNTQIRMKINIRQGSISGTVVYTETQTPTTNTNGLVSIEIGGGAGFNAIDWAAGPYFLETNTDPTGGTNYSISGTSQLLSVPYALHAKTAESISGSITETDPQWTASPSSEITSTNISNWNTAYGWGNHAGLYRAANWVPSWTDIDSKPNFATVATSGSYTDLINKPTIVNSQWTTNGNNIYYNSGNIGIGTSTPSRKLEVASDGTSWISGTFAGSSGTDKVVLGNYNNKAAIGAHNSSLTTWADLIIQFGGGNIGIGNSSPTEKLDVTGNIKASGTITAADGINISAGTVTIKPAGSGGSSGQILTTDGNGNATWQAVSSSRAVTSSSDYTVRVGDNVLISNATTSITYTLPDAALAGSGAVLYFYGMYNPFNITSSQTIYDLNGAAKTTLSGNFSVILASDGVNKWVQMR